MTIDNSDRSKTIAKNTIVLYIRMIFVLGVSLYTSRVLLDVLGVEDYGVYNVVGGIVTMLGFFNGAMVSSTQRFFSFAIGQNDLKQLCLNYSTILIIQVGLALLILLLAETAGLWFVNNYLVIPAERLNAALWVYQFAVMTFIVTILQVPFTAMIITHERMKAFAYISIADIIMKLLVVIALPIVHYDKLIIYAELLFFIALLTFITYVVYTRIRFKHVKYVKEKNRTLFRTLTSYMGWNLWGNAAAVIMNQGVNILINLFFGPAVNAARAIAYQVQSAVNQLVANFQLAMNPQIVKSYASNDLNYMHSLIIRGSKLSFFLIFTLALPVSIETEFLLSIWLKDIPQHAIQFTILVMILACIDSFSGTLMVAAQASGRIKLYQSVVGGLLILNLPLSYIALKLGSSAETTMYIAITISLLALYFRLRIISPLVGLKGKMFLMGSILPSSLVAISSIAFSLTIKYNLQIQSQINSIIVILITVISTIIFTMVIGLTREEQSFIKTRVFKKQ
ncbi:MAG: lipopolysaccharide biosynthesis protein [Porphyromonas sp.]|nr:lipopolysaccharide biosynthesis protein [Porphyromonas sp.]